MAFHKVLDPREHQSPTNEYTPQVAPGVSELEHGDGKKNWEKIHLLAIEIWKAGLK